MKSKELWNRALKYSIRNSLSSAILVQGTRNNYLLMRLILSTSSIIKWYSQNKIIFIICRKGDECEYQEEILLQKEQDLRLNINILLLFILK